MIHQGNSPQCFVLSVCQESPQEVLLVHRHDAIRAAPAAGPCGRPAVLLLVISHPFVPEQGEIDNRITAFPGVHFCAADSP